MQTLQLPLCRRRILSHNGFGWLTFKSTRLDEFLKSNHSPADFLRMRPFNLRRVCVSARAGALWEMGRSLDGRGRSSQDRFSLDQFEMSTGEDFMRQISSYEQSSFALDSSTTRLIETFYVSKQRLLVQQAEKPVGSKRFSSPRYVLFVFAILIVALLPKPAALAQSCTGTGTGGCQQVACPNGGTTSVTGTVYAPDGTDALPNIFIYIPTTALAPFTDGVSTTDPIVDDVATLVSGSPLVQTTTAANGTFSLTNVPPGSSIPMVIQAGRWRREFLIPSVASCQNTPLTTVTQGGPSSLSGYGESTPVRFAQTQGEGDIPKMALVTGHSDALECSLRKVGIADTEFTDYTVNVSSGGSGPGRVNLFEGSGSSGARAPTTTHTESTLVGSTSASFSGSLLGSYNVLLLPCQGNSSNYSTLDGRTNVIAFTGAGGRIFATHHSAFYLNQDASIDAAANWTSDSSLSSGNATINTTFSSGNTLAEWLQDIGATTTQGQVAMTSLFRDQSSVNSPTQSWATLNSAPSDVLQLTFYTPVDAATTSQYGRVMYNEYHVDNSSAGSSTTFPAECTGTLAKNQAMTTQEHMLEYSLFDLMNFAVPVASTNVGIAITPSPSTFTGGDAADTIAVDVTNNGASAIGTNPTVTLAVTLPAGLTALTMIDPSGNWSCNVGTLACILLNPLTASATNSVTVTVSVAANVLAGSGSIGATVSSTGFVSSTTGNVSLSVQTAPAGTVTGPAETTATSTNIGSSTTAAATLTFAISAGTTISSILVVTEGFTGKDFSNAGSGTCAAQAYGSASACTVAVSFAPLYPGERNGAVEIIGTGNTLLETAYISGIGTAPDAIFEPGTQSLVASESGAGNFDDVAVDVQGNVYIVDYTNNQILKETLSSGSYSQSTAFSGLSGPSGIAIDGAGNLYIANATGNQVLKEGLVNGSYSQTTVGNGLANPDGVTADGSGNVYIADSSNNRVLLETLSNGTYLQSVIATGLNNPWRVAVDVSGNVYIADTGSSQVFLETMSSGSYTESTVVSGLNSPHGVAVDSNGTIYIADTGNNRVIEEQLVSGGYVQSVLISGLNAPRAVTLDEHGNLYIADNGDNKLYRQDYTDPPSLSFASTTVDTLSSDSPQIVSVVNFGNTALTAVPPGIAPATDFPQLTGNASDCSSSFSLAAAASCTLRIEFDLQSTGSKSASLVLTDNNLNSSLVSQTITLSGTAAAVSIVISPASLSAPVLGSHYSLTLSASAGTSPYTFTVLSGNLPAGISLSASGVLSGTPTAAGPFTFTIQVQDSTSGESGGPYLGSRSYSVTIAAPTIVVAPSTVPNGRVGLSYSQTISASGGSGPYSYAVTGGTLPHGLSLNSATGALTGTPTTGGGSTFIITATDTVTTGPGAPYTGSQSYSPVMAQITLSPASLSAPVLGSHYSLTLSASGGTSPYTFSILSGSLPAGISLSTGGMLSGTPTAAGSFTFTIQAQDSTSGESGGPYTGSRSYSVTIAAPTIVVAPSTVPNGRVGISYSQTISASGGSGSYHYAVTGGSLPQGMSLNSATGVLAGTLTTAGASTLTITATDTVTAGPGAPYAGSQTYSLTVAEIVISPASISAPVLGSPYNLSLSAIGGTSPYAFTILSGSLPKGVSLSTGGVFSGTPTEVGTFTFTVQAQDSTNAEGGGPYTGSRSYSVTIAAPTVVIAPSALPNGGVGTPYSQTISASGGSGSYRYSVTGGSLPPGVSLNSGNGILTGTPTTAGASTFTLTATDTVSTGPGAPYTGSQTYSLTVAQPTAKASTSLALATSSNPAVSLSSVTFTATISSSSGVPTGSVNFLDGAATLGSGTISGGAATLSTSSLTVGSHSITAVYTGNTNLAASSSSALSQAILNFGVDPVSSGSGGGTGASQTVSPGETAKYTIAITPTSGATFPTITYLTVTGLPAGATAVLTTSGWKQLTSTKWSLPAFSQLSDVSLSFHVPASSTAKLSGPSPSSGKFPATLAALFLLPLAVRLRRSGKSPKWATLLPVLVVCFATLSGLAGCGATNGFYSKGKSPQATSYTVTVTVTTGALSHFTNVTLTVQ